MLRDWFRKIYSPVSGEGKEEGGELGGGTLIGELRRLRQESLASYVGQEKALAKTWMNNHHDWLINALRRKAMKGENCLYLWDDSVKPASLYYLNPLIREALGPGFEISYIPGSSLTIYWDR